MKLVTFIYLTQTWFNEQGSLGKPAAETKPQPPLTISELDTIDHYSLAVDV